MWIQEINGSVFEQMPIQLTDLTIVAGSIVTMPGSQLEGLLRRRLRSRELFTEIRKCPNRGATPSLAINLGIVFVYG